MFWNLLNEFESHQELSELLNRQGFGINLVHAAVESFLHVLSFDMASDGDDPWLLVSRNVDIG